MPLSNELISQFVKATKDTTADSGSSAVYGTVVYDGRLYVKLDGSDLLTPVNTTSNVTNGERVAVTIKDHTATITGGASTSAVKSKDTEDDPDQITNFEIVMAHKVTTEDLEALNAIIETLRSKLIEVGQLEATVAIIDELRATFANLEHITANDITAITAKIESLEAIFGKFTDVSTENLEALNAEIINLKGYTAKFTYLSASVLDAVRAKIQKLDADFANIKFADIDKANIAELYAKSGLIEDATIKDGEVTGKLIAVTIKGDLIEVGTLKADKLIIQGEDGLYYRLNTNGVTTSAEQTDYNSLNGSIITAQSVTADKIKVSDLVAFGATIGGFDISDEAIHSHLKPEVNSPGRGFYVDTDGQIVLGDDENFLKYYKEIEYVTNGEDGSGITEEVVNSATLIDDYGTSGKLYSYVDSDGVMRYFFWITLFDEPFAAPVDRVEKYRLAISADSIMFGKDGKTSAADLRALTEHVKIGTIDVDGDGNDEPCVELAEGDTDFKQVITNKKTLFMDGSEPKTELDTDGIKTENVVVRGDLRQGEFAWTARANGNYGLSWMGGTS